MMSAQNRSVEAKEAAGGMDGPRSHPTRATACHALDRSPRGAVGKKVENASIHRPVMNLIADGHVRRLGRDSRDDS